MWKERTSGEEKYNKRKYTHEAAAAATAVDTAFNTFDAIETEKKNMEREK